MMIQEKSCRGSELIPLETALLTTRTIFVEGDITPESACTFVKQVMVLNQTDAEEPIRLLICSPGGEINAGLLMYDTIQASEAPIKTFCVGHAYSMAAVLFASGTHGRYMLPHSELMLHEPLVENRISGNASAIKSISDSLLETRNKINHIIAIHTGLAENDVEELLCCDHFFSPQKSLAFGLCDGVIDFDQIIKEAWENECR